MRTKVIASLVIFCISFMSYSMEGPVRRATISHTKSERNLPHLSEEKSSGKVTIIRSKSSQKLPHTRSLKSLTKPSSKNDLSRSTSGLTRTSSSRSFGRTSSDLSFMSPSERSSTRSASPINCLHSDVEETRLKKELFRLANYSCSDKVQALKKLKSIQSQGLTNLNVFDENNFTPLRMAAKKGREGVVKALLEMKVLPDICCRGHNTALIDAASGGHASIVSLLLAAGANIEACNGKGETALWCAAREKHLDAVKALIREKANVNHEVNDQTLLIWAVKARYLELVKELIAAKANVDTRDLCSKTALDYAHVLSEEIDKSFSASVEKKFDCEEIVRLLEGTQ